MTHRDRGVAAALLLAFALLSVLVLRPPDVKAPVPSVAPTASPVAARPYREGFLGQPTSVSPFAESTPADRALVALTFSGLVRLGPGGTFVPDLASSWTVDPAGRTYTFELRPDATWQDGESVTAQDVEYTIGVLKDPSYTGPGGASWQDVSVSAVGPLTVRFELGEPIAGFLSAATQPIAPAHLLEGVAPADLPTNPFGQAPIGSGPYRLLSWNAGEASLERVAPASTDPTLSASPSALDSPTAGGPATTGVPTTPGTSAAASASASASPSAATPGAGPPRIEFRFSEDPQALVAAYRAGDLDAVSGLPPVLAAQLGSGAGSRLLRYPTSTLTAVLFDLRAGKAMFRDARVRRGLLEAIDRDAIVADPMAGLAVRADAPIPPSSPVYDASASPPVAHDATAAAKDLTAGGWRHTSAGWIPAGEKAVTPLRLLCPEAGPGALGCTVAESVAAGWRAIGLEVEVIPLSPSELVAAHLRTGDFDVAVLEIALGLDPDLYPLLASSQTLAGGSNISGLQDPKLDRLLGAARTPGTGDASLSAWHDLQSYLAASTFLLPIAFRDEVVVASDALTGPTVRPIGDGSDRFYDVLAWRLADDR